MNRRFLATAVGSRRGVTRREALVVGGLAALGLSVADANRFRHAARAAGQASPRERAKACILIWLDGGPSHLETFDLKPKAPAEVRGPFQAASTSVPGIQLCEHLPRTAERMRHLAIIRSLTSPLGEHNFGAHYMLTGYRPTPVLEYPAIGSTFVSLGEARGVLPPHVAAPNFRVGGGGLTGNGFLPSSARPFSLGADPARPNFEVRDMRSPDGMSAERVARRRRFLAHFNDHRHGDEPAGLAARDPDFEQAFELVASPEARRAFDLTEESAATRARYGARTIGQSCLLARRLVERGTPFVTVNHLGWDTHDDAYTRLLEGYAGAVAQGNQPVGLIPSLDMALAALLDDLAERGLLDETLIVVMGEFGRTPKINTRGGRDHWPRVFSAALAGGGVSGGQVIGASDAVGESPRDRPVTPSDLAASILWLLGIDPTTTLHTPDGRSVHAAHPESQLIAELWS